MHDCLKSMTFPDLPNISDEYKCIFVHIPKAAGSSIKQALNLRGSGHPPWTLFARQYPKQWNEYLTFTVVRNPWDRVVSAFAYAKMERSYWHDAKMQPHPDYELLKGMGFQEFCGFLKQNARQLQHESWFPQYLWVTEERDRKIATVVRRVLRYENLDEHFPMLKAELGISDVALPHVNKSDRGSYLDYYDAESAQIVADLYEMDIKLFGYEF
jgi:hypothetical protein